jgi:hypothetical protein
MALSAAPGSCETGLARTGLRCTIGYAALGRLGMTYRRRQRDRDRDRRGPGIASSAR